MPNILHPLLVALEIKYVWEERRCVSKKMTLAAFYFFALLSHSKANTNKKTKNIYTSTNTGAHRTDSLAHTHKHTHNLPPCCGCVTFLWLHKEGKQILEEKQWSPDWRRDGWAARCFHSPPTSCLSVNQPFHCDSEAQTPLRSPRSLSRTDEQSVFQLCLQRLFMWQKKKKNFNCAFNDSNDNLTVSFQFALVTQNSKGRAQTWGYSKKLQEAEVLRSSSLKSEGQKVGQKKQLFPEGRLCSLQQSTVWLKVCRRISLFLFDI